MKIALVAPLDYPVPPPKYGGTQRVVYHLSEGLVGLGHDVTLFAKEGSRTNATPRLYKNPTTQNKVVGFLQMMQDIEDDCNKFDIIHFHTNADTLVRIDKITNTQKYTSIVNTTHILSTFFTHERHRYLKHPYYVAISMSQEKSNPKMNYEAMIYNGLGINDFPFEENTKRGKYLVFIGRMDPSKNPVDAILASLKSGIPLKIGARISNKEYYLSEVKPLIDANPGMVEFLGEITEREKINLLVDSYATLFPIKWKEPFGLTMLESLACGVPVIAYPRGAVPEIIRDGREGFFTNNVDEMVTAIKRVSEIKANDCRKRALVFDASKMVSAYESLYRRIVDETNR